MARDDDALSGAGTLPATDVERASLPSLAGGRYTLIEEIGKGGMGCVHRALDRSLGVTVALKVLSLPSEDARAQLVGEVRLGRRVTHPNVVRIYDLGEADGEVYLTMELFEGPSLDRLLRDGPLPLERALEIASGICAGLAAVHAAGVVHRDLKPGNVLIGPSGQPVIADFGIATEPGLAHGSIVGTPYYIAPEQLRGAAPGPHSDLYALGLILFEMVTGRRPFERETVREEMASRLHAAPPDPAALRPVPTEVSALVARLLDPEPERRPESARAALLALREVAGRLGPPTEDVYAPMPPAKNAIAVLPFERLGGAEAGLGELLAEELVDALSRTRELRVVSSRDAGADPSRVADQVLSGSVVRLGSRLRISARLSEAESGVVLFSQRVDTDDEDLFRVTAGVSRRVTEALRLEVATLPYRDRVPQEALECFRRAREALAGNVPGARLDDALEDLDRCVALAPAFQPAYPLHALTALDAWWSGRLSTAHDGHARARVSVQRALAHASERAETHVASGSLHLQVGDYREAAKALSTALALAPTCARAQALLGNLQMEAGRLREGVGRIEQSIELDPGLRLGHLHLARHDALGGDPEAASGRLAHLLEADARNPGVLMAEFRFALWAGAHDRARRARDLLASTAAGRDFGLGPLLGVGLGDASEGVREAYLARRAACAPHPRFDVLTGQLWVEMLAAADRADEALSRLEELAAGPLVDLDWLERCPGLGPLRGDARLRAVTDIVARRAASVWR